MTDPNVLEARLRDLYRDLRTQSEIIGILRAEIIKLAKRVEKLENPAEASECDPGEDLPRQQR